MTDREALERAVLLGPDEDVPRLEYADWLEENPGEGRECGRCGGKGRELVHNDMHYSPDERQCPACRGTGRIDAGHRERAELIRVQFEMEKQRAGVYEASLENDREQDRLTARSRELVARGRGLGWWDALGCNPDQIRQDGSLAWYGPAQSLITATVRRGFVERLTLPIAAFTPDLAAAVFGRHPVREVAFSDVESHLGIDPFLDGSGCFWRVNTLPMFLWKRVSTGSPGSRIADVYPTRDAAVEALSRAAVAWGREIAGLTATRKG